MFLPALRAPVRTFMILGCLFLHHVIAVLSSDPAISDSRSQDSPRICPLPRCERCPSIDQIQAPGVGFALEMGYGVVALRLHNGTYQNIALIDGKASYASLLRNLATGPQNRIPDQIPSNWEKLRYLKKRAQRHLNKSLGRPATPETAILAEMISMLKTAGESWLRGEIVTAAVLSSPDRIRLTAEEITDVFDYLKMRNLMAEPDTLEDLYATSAAYAGFGIGLCEQYTDAYACEREEYRFPTQRVLHLDFTPESLSGTIKSLTSARDGSVETTFIDIGLGLGRLAAQSTTSMPSPKDDTVYWTTIASRIRALVQSFKPQITQLLLTGSSAADQRFRSVVKDALRDVVAQSVLNTHLNDRETTDDGGLSRGQVDTLVFATARGAAEVAKRRQEGPVRCAESEECKRRREREKGSSAQEEKTDAELEL